LRKGDDYCIDGVFLNVLSNSDVYCSLSFIDSIDIFIKGINYLSDNFISNTNKTFVVELDGSFSRIKDLDDFYFTKENLPSLAFFNCNFDQKICVQQNATLIDYKSNKVYIASDESEENKLLESPYSLSHQDENISKLIIHIKRIKKRKKIFNLYLNNKILYSLIISFNLNFYFYCFFFFFFFFFFFNT